MRDILLGMAWYRWLCLLNHERAFRTFCRLTPHTFRKCSLLGMCAPIKIILRVSQSSSTFNGKLVTIFGMFCMNVITFPLSALWAVEWWWKGELSLITELLCRYKEILVWEMVFHTSSVRRERIYTHNFSSAIVSCWSTGGTSPIHALFDMEKGGTLSLANAA